jgi:outer membrane receptor for monomeric catechols
LDKIIWKTLVYNGDAYNNFEVSTDGQLRNVKTGTVYKQTYGGSGYLQVVVSIGSRSKKKAFKIHKAVAETFISNPDNKPEVNHKNGDKNKNDVSNLEWATSSENVQHAYQNGLMLPRYGTDNHIAKLTKDEVVYIREHYIPRDKEYGARPLARKFGIDHTCILDIINGVSYANV